VLVFSGLLLLVGVSIVRAAIQPRCLHYQGCLTDGKGRPLPDEARSMTFKIWDAETAGTVLWSENQKIATRDGLYNVDLGIVSPLSMPFNAKRWLGIQVEENPEQVPRVPVVPTAYCYNADMVDGRHLFGGAPSWSGAGYAEGLGKTTNFWVPGDSGPADLYFPIVHFYPFRIVLTCPHAAPQVGDMACVDCVENDGVISCLGVDGTGAQVRSTFSLSSGDQILSVRGGHVTLSCPGDGSRRLKVHTEGEWVLGYTLF
jgi:hypothetical protein